MAEVNNRTRAVICSAISWDTGYRMDLETLGARCARAGCLLFVDGIHAVGAENLNLNILGVSGMSFHSYKWLCAGFGIGGLYVSPQAVDQIRPTFVGPQGVDGDLTAYQNNPQWRKGAQRFSAGTGNAIGATALNASLSLLEEVGVNAICQNNHMLATALADGIKQALPQARLLRSPNHVNQSAIVVFTTGSHANDAMLVAKLESNGVVVAHRPQGIRVSPHFFNTLQDIEKFLAAL
jgi:selenocysteine lyase/cysteine desulfurase